MNAELKITSPAQIASIPPIHSAPNAHLVLQPLVLEPIRQWFEQFFHLLVRLLRFASIVQLQAFFCHILEFLAFEFGHCLDAVLVHWLRQVYHFIALLQQAFHKRRVFQFLIFFIYKLLKKQFRMLFFL